MSDTRPIEEFRFGLEWEPKLAEVMARFPWPDSEFKMADPKTICKICGRAVGSINHAIDNAEGIRHNFVPTVAWTTEQIAESRDEWCRRMENLPTPEAENAWAGIHAERMERLRALLKKSNSLTRDNIETLGCTGCASFGFTLDDIKFLRIGLAGSGVGLPCFVPPGLYCLAHETTGGLQEGQNQGYVAWVDKISRPLTDIETSHDKLVSAARKSDREHGAHSLLHGHTMPKGWEEVEEIGGVEGGAQIRDYEAQLDRLSDDLVAARAAARAPSFKWECDVHEKTDWSCRYCAAQAVIEGELVPVYVLDVNHPTGTSGMTDAINGAQVAQEIAEEDASNSNSVKLYVRVATFTRKLARD